MTSDSLAMSGITDMASESESGFVSAADNRDRYYSPENQINKTEDYNEMDFYRRQNGERKQPDYIIVFRENGEVKNMEEAKKAQEQWGGLPIVIVDKDKCLEAERQKVEEMMVRYEAGNKRLAGAIYQKVRNNRVTRSSFCSEIDIEKFKEEAEVQKQENEKQKLKYKEQRQAQEIIQQKGKVKEKELKENYDKVTPQERKEEVNIIRKINNQIQQITNGKVEKEGEEVGGE